jgi:hypothetical protein
VPSTAEEGLLVAALIATGAALVLALAFRGWLLGQRRVRPVEVALDDAGPEPPAVVNLLTHGCRTTRESAAATVLDLAERGVLSIDEVAVGRSIVHLRDADVDGLARFERMVLDALADRAVDGDLPSDAASLPAEDLSDRWWRRYEAAVLEECVDRGLIGGVAGSRRTLLLLCSFLIPPFLALLAYGGDIERAFATPWSTVLALATVVPGVLVAVNLVPTPALTDDGRVAAARWLGARRQLAEAELAPHGPAGVRVWGHHLADAAAMGLAPEVVRELPYGTEDPRHAWSSSGGAWRQVEIRYRRWRPAWGRRPSRVLLLCLVVLVAGAPLSLALHEVEGAPMAEPLAAAVAVVAGLALLGAAACVVDLVTERHVDGEVIRLAYIQPALDAGIVELLQGAGWFLVVDDGRSTWLPGWAIGEDDVEQLAIGQRLRVEVTPCLGYVVGYEPLG